MAPFMFFAQLPEMDQLTSLSLRLIDAEFTGSNRGSTCEEIYTVFIWKCRELLFMESKVLAAPSPGAKCIEIVVPKYLVQDISFMRLLEKLTLQVAHSGVVTESVFKRCLSYTIAAKLAPEWNKVGDYFVQGRNFLASGESAKALRLEVNVNKSQICLAPTFVTLDLPVMKLDELDIDGNVLAKFNQKQCHEVDGARLGNAWCHVLPSLKKGVIVSITHDIPPSSLFSNPGELQSYWKNTYGYRIPVPNDDSPTVYYNIRFYWMNSVIFTYPSVCVTPFKPNAKLQTKECALESHSQFSSELVRRMPLICGLPWLKKEEPLMHLTFDFLLSSTQSQASQYVDTPLNVERVLHSAKPVESTTHSASSSIGSQISLYANQRNKQVGLPVLSSFAWTGRNGSRPETETSSSTTTNSREASKIVPVFEKTIDAATLSTASQKRRPLNCVSVARKSLNDDEIASFCKKGQLNKVKVALLANWARKKGIFYYSRMRKSELVGRIEKFVLMNAVEP